jgi:urocanate hydratase
VGKNIPQPQAMNTQQYPAPQQQKKQTFQQAQQQMQRIQQEQHMQQQMKQTKYTMQYGRNLRKQGFSRQMSKIMTHPSRKIHPAWQQTFLFVNFAIAVSITRHF